MARLPMAPNVLIHSAKQVDPFVGPVDTQEFVDLLIIPLRRPRAPSRGPRPGTTDCWFDPAPGWAANLVDRVVGVFFNRVKNGAVFRCAAINDLPALLAFAQRLLETEERARAATFIIDSIAAMDESDARSDGENPRWPGRLLTSLPLTLVELAYERLRILP